MALKRRKFLKIALGAGAIAAAPLAWVFKHIAPARYTEALKARFYPGPVCRIDETLVRKPGKWAG